MGFPIPTSLATGHLTFDCGGESRGEREERRKRGVGKSGKRKVESGKWLRVGGWLMVDG
jgi:hypothetical protein